MPSHVWPASGPPKIMVTKGAEVTENGELTDSRTKLATVMTISWCSIAVTATVRREGVLGITLLPRDQVSSNWLATAIARSPWPIAVMAIWGSPAERRRGRIGAILEEPQEPYLANLSGLLMETSCSIEF